MTRTLKRFREMETKGGGRKNGGDDTGKSQRVAGIIILRKEEAT